MRTDWRWMILLVLPAIVGMRDPFSPPEDKCSAAQLTLWHFRGWMVSDGQFIGLVQGPEGKWQRIKEGQQLTPSWTVSAIGKEQMDIALGTECEPSQWRWKKEGTINEAKDLAVHGAADDQRHRKGKNRLPDGG